MRIAPDTNVLVRVAICDDPDQMKAAEAALRDAELVAISTHALCEFVWVMRRIYKQPNAPIAKAIRLLIASANVRFDVDAVEAGLAMLDAGGDFADGVIAHEGRALGGNTFVSFDKSAAGMLKREGVKVRVLG